MIFLKARLKKLWKGVKHAMEQFVDTAREILTGKNSRFVAACILEELVLDSLRPVIFLSRIKL